LFGYDLWYQPRDKKMISLSWGAPAAFRSGLVLQEVAPVLSQVVQPRHHYEIILVFMFRKVVINWITISLFDILKGGQDLPLATM
jgi:hypothetical protein